MLFMKFAIFLNTCIKLVGTPGMLNEKIGKFSIEKSGKNSNLIKIREKSRIPGKILANISNAKNREKT